MLEMRALLSKRINRKGFTLAELLVVVAIIAILVAVSIPIFTGQLDKAAKATDAANIRAAKAAVANAILSDDKLQSDYENGGQLIFIYDAEAGMIIQFNGLTDKYAIKKIFDAGGYNQTKQATLEKGTAIISILALKSGEPSINATWRNINSLTGYLPAGK